MKSFLRSALVLLVVATLVNESAARSPPVRPPKLCICNQSYIPICGTNGKTYGNASCAKCDGVGVRCTGECPCGLFEGDNRRPATCSCFELYDPVCGTNGKTYSNKCMASCEKIKKACDGECPCRPIACPLCKRAPCTGVTCKAYPLATCVPRKCSCEEDWYHKGEKVDCRDNKPPSACCFTKNYRPVCGYNGVTHNNSCDACKKKMPVKCNGKCPCPCSKGLVNCFVNPCTVNKCPKYPDAKCYPDYCGGCHAIYVYEGKVVKCDGKKPIPHPKPHCAKMGESCHLGGNHHLSHSRTAQRCCHGLRCCKLCPAHLLSAKLRPEQHVGRCARRCKLC